MLWGISSTVKITKNILGILLFLGTLKLLEVQVQILQCTQVNQVWNLTD